jgi:hypothetical protein
VTALSDALRTANDGRYSARQLSRLARDAGFSLNHDTAARYLRGEHGRPDEPTLRAFAVVLDIELAILREAAGLPFDQTDPYQPPPESSRLSRRQRRAVDEIIKAMLDPGIAPDARDSLDTRGPDALADDLARRRAARGGPVEPPAPPAPR